MARYFIHRGKPGDAWASFPAHYLGIPERGYYLRKDAAYRAAERIAAERNEPTYVTASVAD